MDIQIESSILILILLLITTTAAADASPTVASHINKEH